MHAARRGLAGVALAVALAGCSSAAVPQGTSSAPSTAGSSKPSTSATTSPTSPSSTPASSQPATPSYCADGGGASGASGTLDAVQFVGANGWVAGDGQILGTSDSGANWITQWQGSAPLDAVDFVNALDGWAVGPGVALATTDGGAKWNHLAEPPGGLDAAHFWTSSAGVGVTGGSFDSSLPGVPACGGTLVATSDGGATWSQVKGAPGNVEATCSSGAGGIWIAAVIGNEPHLLWTAEGGTTWTDVFTPPFRSGQAQAPLWTQLECTNGAVWAYFATGGAAAGNEGYFAYRLAPSGAAAVMEEAYTESQALPAGIPAGPGSYPSPFSVLGDGAAIFTGYTPAATKPASVALATTGRPIATIGRFSQIWRPTAISFADGQHGWAVGVGLLPAHWYVESTTDGGAHWKVQLSERSAPPG